jgi:hypothetical protein
MLAYNNNNNNLSEEALTVGIERDEANKAKFKAAFECLQLEFANRLPDIQFVLTPNYEILRNGINGIKHTTLAEFRAVDAEEIVDKLLVDPKNEMRLYEMKQADCVNVFIDTSVKISGTVEYEIYLSWQYRKNVGILAGTIHVCILNSCKHQPFLGIGKESFISLHSFGSVFCLVILLALDLQSQTPFNIQKYVY